MAKTTIRCPECGAAFEIPAKTLLGVIGNVLGEDSNLGDCYLKTKEQEPKKPLRGPDGRFMNNSMHGIDLAGEEYDEKNSDKYGVDASLSEKIRNGKPVKNHRLFRRWIMSQVFHALQEMERCGGTPFTNIVRRRGIRYMADVIKNEVHDMLKCREHGDVIEYRNRSRWWNESTIFQIGSQFVDILTHEIDRLKVRKCRGRPYKRIPGFGNVFVEDIQKKVVEPLRRDLEELVSLETSADTFEDVVVRICDKISRFKESCAWKIHMPSKFLDCYKGNGAYYTLQNMIQFHDCKLPDEVRDGEHGDMKGWHRDMAILDDLAEKYKNSGWQLLGLVKDTIEANGIDIDKKIESWQK